MAGRADGHGQERITTKDEIRQNWRRTEHFEALITPSNFDEPLAAPRLTVIIYWRDCSGLREGQQSFV